MKSRMILVVCFILAVNCFSGVAAQNNSALTSQVESLYNRLDGAVQAKDLEASMSLYADDFQLILAGMDRAAFRDAVKKGFDENEQLRAQHTTLAISRSGNMVKVISDQKVEGRSGEGDWKLISQETRVEFLVPENGGLKFSRSAAFDKAKLDSVIGKTYTDKESGFSLPYRITGKSFRLCIRQ